MKVLVLYCFLLLFYNSYSQNDSVFLSISASKQNVVYYGIDNPINIGITNLCGQIPNVTCDNGIIRYIGNGQYLVKPSIHGGYLTITVHYIKDEKEVEQKVLFRIKRLPDPVINCIGLKFGSSVQKIVLLSVPPQAIYEDFVFDIKFTILSYELSTSKDKNFIISTDKSFENQQRAMLRELSQGDTVFLRNFEVITCDSIKRHFAGGEYYIK